MEKSKSSIDVLGLVMKVVAVGFLASVGYYAFKVGRFVFSQEHRFETFLEDDFEKEFVKSGKFEGYQIISWDKTAEDQSFCYYEGDVKLFGKNDTLTSRYSWKAENTSFFDGNTNTILDCDALNTE